MKVNLIKLNNAILSYLKTESGCIKVGSNKDSRFHIITFDILNPDHSSVEIWNNVAKIFNEYPGFASCGSERVDEQTIRITYRVDLNDAVFEQGSKKEQCIKE